jgi:hypothetical protein
MLVSCIAMPSSQARASAARKRTPITRAIIAPYRTGHAGGVGAHLGNREAA